MTYKLKSLDVSNHHWPDTVMLVRDGSMRTADKSELEAQAQSGDYLSLLATRLDQISQSLKRHHHTDYIILEGTIQDLVYLQNRFKLVKK
jgi:hypothetical protein